MKPNVLLLFADQHKASVLGSEDHPDVLTPHRRRTQDFLRAHQDTEQPFFCFASFYRPHQPYTPLRE